MPTSLALVSEPPPYRGAVAARVNIVLGVGPGLRRRPAPLHAGSPCSGGADFGRSTSDLGTVDAEGSGHRDACGAAVG